MKFYRLTAFSVLILSLSIAGCGYTREAVLPRNIKTIYVDTVKNKVPLDKIYAYVAGLEMDITNAIIKRLHEDGNLRVVKHNEADAVLEANLIGFEQEGVRFTSLESVEEYRLFIVLELKLLDGRTGEILWEELSFSGDTEYFVSDVRTLAREKASEEAVINLARNVVDRIVEDW
ncbi:MAG: LPS assembly lipoprotein LptE [Candidatus Omnitrophota bacterium]|nr:LPS assembly lipoprotein LptE [Candidatus Omnitrophota bacterium]